MIEILYKSKNAIVIYKPYGIPTQSDLSKDSDAMTLTSEILSRSGEDNRLWLIHRLDRTVGGLLVFARNRQSAAALSEIVRERQITKEYLAVVSGMAAGGVLTDFLFKDGRMGRAYVTDRQRSGVKEASLEYRSLKTVHTERGSYSLVYIKLHTGRFHQIRAQFSSRQMPLVGDGKYGSKDNRAKNIALFATRVCLDVMGEHIEVKRLPDLSAYPWNLFDTAIFEGMWI